MDDPTRYDVIVQLQEKLELMEERDAQRDGEMDTLGVLQRLEQRKRLLSDDILEEALEERVAGAANRIQAQPLPSRKIKTIDGYVSYLCGNLLLCP